MSNDFVQFIQQIKSNPNPQKDILSLLESSAARSPMGANLLQLAKAGDTAAIEKIARNVVASSGKDFDKEFKAFKQQWGF